MTAAEDGDGWSVEGDWYRLSGTRDGLAASLDDRGDHGSGDGRRWADVRVLASIDTLTAIDETLAVAGPAIERGPALASGSGAAAGSIPIARLTWTLSSSIWPAKRLVIDAFPGTVAIHAEVDAVGMEPAPIREVSLLAGRAVLARSSGTLMSGRWFESVVSGSPREPGRIVRSAGESDAIGVVSGADPGRGRWFFTPGPFVYAVSRSAVSRSAVADEHVLPDGSWLWFGLAAEAGAAGFTEFAYRAEDRGFGFGLDYEGKTQATGRWQSPRLVIGRATDPYAAIAAWRGWLDEGGLLPVADRGRRQPDWWRQPIFCGWGAQGALAREAGLPLGTAARYADQPSYDRFLDDLERMGVRPGTIVIDDKWQADYGTCEPDPDRWPDLAGWIADRHRDGRHVLLWYKAWDAAGLPADWCVRSAAGTALGIDPTNPDGEAAIRRAVRRMLAPAPDGLDADGLKIDFTARTPSGIATEHHGGAWGVDLLRRLLDTVADEARRIKPESLLVGHTPNPLIASAVDMLRLNDMLRLDDPDPIVDVVPQMRHRATIARAACPDHLIDTDDWCAPNLAGWRAWTAAKIELGVPALYYTTRLDLSDEVLEPADAELLRRTWADYRAAARLVEPSAGLA